MSLGKIEIMREMVVGAFMLNQFIKMFAIFFFPPVFLNHAELQRFITFDSAKRELFC